MSNTKYIKVLGEDGNMVFIENPDYIPPTAEELAAMKQRLEEGRRRVKFGGIQYKCVGEGWHSFVKPLEEFCVSHGIGIRQIKEKFALVRIYIEPETDDNPFVDQVNGWIIHAEEMSSMYCEKCGSQGFIHQHRGWLATLCTKHHIERAQT